MTQDIKDDPNLAARLTALAKTAEALGLAIRGAGNNPAHIDSVKELCNNLNFISKRVAWLEKSTNPNWEPYDESKKQTKTAKP